MESNEIFSDQQRQRLTYCLYLVGFLDLFGVSLLIPLISHHARELGASPTTVGTILSVYGTIQLFSGPLIGRWSDVSGRRFVLLVCLFISAVGYFMKGIATSVIFLVLSRVPLGFFKHGMNITRALIAEFTPKEDRPRVFGQYNACSSMGFIVGPLIGGHLSETEGGFYKVATITSLLFFLDFVVVYFFVHPPKSGTLARTESVQAFTTDEFTLNIREFIKSFRLIFHTCFDLFLVRFLMSFAVMIYRSNFSLMLEEAYQITPKTIGQIMSYGAVVGFLSGMCTGRVVRYYGNVSKLLFYSSIAEVINILGLTFAPTIPIFLVFSTSLSIWNPITRVCITELSVKKSSLQNTGALLGLSQSMLSMARAIAPFLAGLTQEISPKGPGVIGVFSAALGCICILIYLKDESVVQKKED